MINELSKDENPGIPAKIHPTITVFYFLFKKKKNKIRTKILPVVLYGHETSSCIIRDENNLTLFENRVLRQLLWPKKDEVLLDGWRNVHGGFHDF